MPEPAAPQIARSRTGTVRLPPIPKPPIPAPPIPALPIPVPLVHGETLDSYLYRLARANHHTTRTLLRYLCYPRPAEIAALHPERLAAAAGRPLEQLASRLHKLDPAPNRHGHKPRADLEARPACRRCTARHGIAGPVIRATPAHHTICRRHQLWIGPGTHTTADQHDLQPFPEMLRAQRRHHRLLRHHPDLAPTAHRHAERLIRHWLSRDELPADHHRRLAHYLNLAPTNPAHTTTAGTATYDPDQPARKPQHRLFSYHTPTTWQRLNPAQLAHIIAAYPTLITLTQLLTTHYGTNLNHPPPHGPNIGLAIHQPAAEYLTHLAQR